MAAPSARSWTEVTRVRNVGRRDDSVIVDCGSDQLWIDFPLAGVARVRLAVAGKLPKGASGVIRRKKGSPGAVEERRGRITVRAPGLEIEIKKDPAGLTFRDDSGRLLVEAAEGAHAHRGERVRLTQQRATGERIYGLGEKTWGVERSGRKWRMWNTDCVSYQRGTDPLYKSIPFALLSRRSPTIDTRGVPGVAGRAHYGLFFDNPYATTFDLQERASWSVEATGGPLEYYVIAGPKPSDVLERFTALTGRIPLPPRWALGYQQSRWSYTPERRLRKLTASLREREIPCDVVYLDIDYMDGFRPFTWNKKRFPNPTKLVRDLEKQGFKLVTIIDPGLKAESTTRTRFAQKNGYLLENEQGKPITGKVWPGRCYFPDFTNPDARKWWGEQHTGLVKNGVAGIWTDMNEPALLSDDRRPGEKTLDDDVKHHGARGRRDHRGNHNLYGHRMAEATYDGLLALKPHKRPFVLTRAAFAGTQRFAATWTGDNHSSWKHLELMVPMLLGLGVSGMPFCGADVGGFTGHPTAELFTRWIQAAALTPLFRGHAEKKSPDQEPWAFGPAAEDRSRAAIELRYRLLPYLYTVFEESTRTGAPIMRPVWWTFPDDPRAQTVENAFMVGDMLLVAPVLGRGATSRSVYFPQGTWVPLDGRGNAAEGPITRSVSAPLDRLPVFVRSGSILPTQAPVQHTGEIADDAPLELVVVLDRQERAAGTLYEDAGDGHDHERRGFGRTVFNAQRIGGELTLTANVDGKRTPPARDVRIDLITPDATDRSKVAHKTVEGRAEGKRWSIAL